MTTQKARHWAGIIYPESVPENWKEIIDEYCVPIAVSPLHDRDVADSTTGELKKPHWHLLIGYPGPTTGSVVQSFLASLGGTRPIVVRDRMAYFRYLTHQDNPDKYQYSGEDVLLFGGYRPEEDTESVGQRYLLALRRLSNCTFRQAVDYFIDEGYPVSWLVSNSHFVSLYLRG